MFGPSGHTALLGSEDKDRSYFAAIETYADERFQQLARMVVARLQKRKASRALDDRMQGAKTLWDEICWFLKEGYVDSMLEYETLHDCDLLCHTVIRKISDAEAVLLSCAASEDQQWMPARDDNELERVLRAYVREHAFARDMSKFEFR